MKILGLDLASSATGWCWSDGEVLRRGCWNLARKGEHEGRRLERLREYLHKCHDAWGIDRIGCEDASFGSNNRHTAATHNELKGIVKLVCYEREIEVVWVNPSTLKKWATGSGRAKKPEMIRAAHTHYGIETDDDNIADAVLIAGFVRQDHAAAKTKTRRQKRRKRAAEPTLFN